MFNAEIDRIVHRGFVEDIMRIFKVTKEEAEKAAIQMEKNMDDMWNKSFYKESETKSESNE